MRVLSALACLTVAWFSFAAPRGKAEVWNRHVVDASSRGADGVRLADVNADGLPDIATGWEEGGKVRAYINPGPKAAKKPWPAVTTGSVPSPEDAVFLDLDSDGSYDVISSTEGDSKTLFVHWAPQKAEEYLDSSQWRTEAIPASAGIARWMFVAPLDIDGRYGVDFFAGSKEPGGAIGWFEAPRDPRDLSAWRWRPLYDAGWIMSLRTRDMDGDGDLDLLASDRKGPLRGILWVENPGPTRARGDWTVHRIGPVDEYEPLFLDVCDLDGDGADDVVVATKGPILFYRRSDDEYEKIAIEPPSNVGGGKAIAIGDIDLDGRLDLVYSCEGASEGREGVVWLSYEKTPAEPRWTAHSLAGPQGVKFDRLELLDLDGDGDLDVLTCEERDNLGVIWYENPTR